MRKNGKLYFYGEILIGLGLFAFSLLGIFLGGHDVLLMGAVLVLSLSFFLKAAERKKEEEEKDELLEEEQDEN